MNTSILAKAGAVTVTAFLAGATWVALSRWRASQQAADAGRLTPTAAGAPADAFSQHAVQHDLSVGDAV
ncbi:hypothetical protein VVD49_19245 [Uliginosibacterium sp. H3]|uniref:Uncharacterized protein n=1 Tax=Uliginosibacterium silvisoli TaxID=3114758 RepID=A0ABU6K8P5_9RHOO|nr:hypothetical protein [Uliginosibacterium sp. H3]